jgi:hypothetical protein
LFFLMNWTFNSTKKITRSQKTNPEFKKQIPCFSVIAHICLKIWSVGIHKSIRMSVLAITRLCTIFFVSFIQMIFEFWEQTISKWLVRADFFDPLPRSLSISEEAWIFFYWNQKEIINYTNDPKTFFCLIIGRTWI